MDAPLVDLGLLHLPRGSEWLAVGMSYLLGAVPFGWLLAKLVKGVDLRTLGSGNIGATNAGRALGRPLGLVAFLCDFGKGWLPAAVLGPTLAAGPDSAASLAVVCGAAAAVGHCWPVTLGFRGGKAVATWCGAVVGVAPFVFLVGGAVWLVALAALRFVSLASMLMAASFPLAALWQRGAGAPLVPVSLVMALLIAARHRANISRMLSGTEPRVGVPKERARA